MKRNFLFFTLCFIPSLFLLGASDTQQVLEKLNSLESSISNLTLRILSIERRIIEVEEKLLRESARETKSYIYNTVKPTENTGLNYEEQPDKTHKGQEKVIDGCFSIENVTYETDYNDTIFRGYVTNSSNSFFKYSLFKLTVYDKHGSVLLSNDFYILNMDRRATRPFETKLRGIKAEEFDRYTIKFNKDP